MVPMTEIRQALSESVGSAPPTDQLMDPGGIAALAARVVRSLSKASGATEDLLADVSKLSDEEVARLLDETRHDDDP